MAGFDAFTKFLRLFISDHDVTITRINHLETKGNFSFKYMWSSHKDFQATVSEVWDARKEGTAMLQLCKSLKSLKGPLKRLNKEHFSHISSRAAKAVNLHDTLKNSLLGDPANQNLQLQVQNHYASAMHLLEAERQFLSQKVKSTYLNLADRDNSFFYGIMKKRECRNHISAIIKQDGTSSSSKDEVAEEFVRVFTNKLGTCSDFRGFDPQVVLDGPCLSEEDNLALDLQITNEEINETIFSIHDSKSPGPDGYTSSFFKSRWVHHYYLGGQNFWESSIFKDSSALMKTLVDLRDNLLAREGSIVNAIAMLDSWIDAGKMCAKKVYDYFKGTIQPVNWAKQVWAHHIPPKQSFYVWLAVKSKLQTRDKLSFAETDKNMSFM